MSSNVDANSAQQSAKTASGDTNIAYLVALFLAIKAGMLLVIVLGSQLLAFNDYLYGVNLVWPLRGLPDFFRPFNTWDTQQYLLLAEQGYGTNPMSNAFYPLYPMLIRWLTPLFAGRELIAAWTISNTISLFVPVYMYKLSRLFWSSEQSLKSTVLLLAFPTAFFASMAYTEAIYLAICLAAFYYLFRREVLKASILCFLMPLVRAQALLFLLPILVMFVEAGWGKGGSWREAAKACLLPAIATALGVGAYLLFCQWQLGSPFAGLDSQKLFIGDNSIANMFNPVKWFERNFLDITPTLHGYTDSIIDRAGFIIMLPLLVGVWRTQPKALFAYALVTLVVPALTGTFMSYSRFLLLVFPVFMFLGAKVRRAELLAVPMFALQMMFLLMHTGGYWVG